MNENQKVGQKKQSLLRAIQPTASKLEGLITQGLSVMVTEKSG